MGKSHSSHIEKIQRKSSRLLDFNQSFYGGSSTQMSLDDNLSQNGFFNQFEANPMSSIWQDYSSYYCVPQKMMMGQQ